MLRGVLIGLAAAVLAASLACLAVGRLTSAAAPLAFWSAVALVGLLIERSRYKRLLEQPPGPDWRDTGERFVDPRSRREVAVYFEPSSRRRAYVAAPPPGGPSPSEPGCTPPVR